MKVIILWGLPASGKTTYAKSLSRGFSIVDCDSHMKQVEREENSKTKVIRMASKGDGRLKPVPPKTLVQIIAEDVESKSYGNTNVIVDGLITTNEDANILMSAIQSELAKKCEFEIVCWRLNREACLHNDQGRRNVNSKISIENLPFEEPNKELLEVFNTKVKYMDVVRKPDHVVWANNQGIYYDKLTSSSWCLGGTSGNCWNNQKTVISGEPQPVSFVELDEILEQICPNLTFMQYKRIQNQCITIDTNSEGDFYGGSVEYGRFVCDLKSLYELLKNMDYIK